MPSLKNPKYATTLPVSREKAHLVKLYCLVHKIQIYRFVDRIIEKELETFKTNVQQLKERK